MSWRPPSSKLLRWWCGRKRRSYEVEIGEKEDATLAILEEDVHVGEFVREVAAQAAHHAQVRELM